MALSFREQVVLAHSLGAVYEHGYWKFPTPELKAAFERQVAGMEWTEQQRSEADAALAAWREKLRRESGMIPLEPGGK